MIGKALLGAGIAVGAVGVPYGVEMVHRFQNRAEEVRFLADGGYVTLHDVDPLHPQDSVAGISIALNPFDKDDTVRFDRCKQYAFRVGEVAGRKTLELVDDPQYGTQALTPDQFRYLCP